MIAINRESRWPMVYLDNAAYTGSGTHEGPGPMRRVGDKVVRRSVDMVILL